MYYSSVGQFGSQGPPQNQTGNGNANVIFSWGPPGQTGPNQGGFIFYYLNVGQYGTSGVDFAQSLGISSFTSDSTGNADLFRNIAWRQLFADGLIDFRIGQVEPAMLFNAMPYANDNRGFVASPLSNEASRTLPAAGVGMTLIGEVMEDVYLGGAISDANGKGEFLNFDSFFQGDHMGSAYVAVEPTIGSLGRGKYQVGAHFIEATDTTPIHALSESMHSRRLANHGTCLPSTTEPTNVQRQSVNPLVEASSARESLASQKTSSESDALGQIPAIPHSETNMY